MALIYKKTLKGVEEIALRSNNLQMRLRVYLILVDGSKSTEMIQSLNPNLSEVEMVLNALHDEGYLQIVSGNKSDVMNDLQANNTQSSSQTNNSFYANTIQNNSQPISNKNNTTDNSANNVQFLQARENMIRDMMVLLGKDAEMVVGKIQRCENGMDLFAMMMGLKKIITMYASNDKAEAFANKFSYVATL